MAAAGPCPGGPSPSGEATSPHFLSGSSYLVLPEPEPRGHPRAGCGGAGSLLGLLCAGKGSSSQGRGSPVSHAPTAVVVHAGHGSLRPPPCPPVWCRLFPAPAASWPACGTGSSGLVSTRWDPAHPCPSGYRGQGCGCPPRSAMGTRVMGLAVGASWLLLGRRTSFGGGVWPWSGGVLACGDTPPTSPATGGRWCSWRDGPGGLHLPGPRSQPRRHLCRPWPSAAAHACKNKTFLLSPLPAHSSKS